ncbi:APC family permease [Streptomyces nigrescens]
MPWITMVSKRILIGLPVRRDKLGETLLRKRIALPVFASDPLSSVAYATEEMLLKLSVAGTAFLSLTPWLAALVVLLLCTVVASYRQVVHAYPSGGGDYEVATRNLGDRAGTTVASALLVDYVLTVAVSTSAGVANIVSAVPQLHAYRVELTLGCVLLLMLLNLRGVRESGRAFAVPTYAFVIGILGLIVTGLVQLVTGHLPRAESADYVLHPEPGHAALGTAGILFLALRGFSSGCTALTGVEAIANGVPAFRRPKSRNAATTLLMMLALSVTMFVGITGLACLSEVRVAENTCDLEGFEGDCRSDPQRTVVAQLAMAVFGGSSSPFFYYILAVTALILILAANTAFNGFPVLSSILGRDRFLPKQLRHRGDRLVFSNGVLLLTLCACLLIVAFDADPNRLVQLYIIGVFISFTLGQSGMVRHWNRALRETSPTDRERRRMRRSRAINLLGAVLTGTVLVIATVSRFMSGAWVVFVAMALIFLAMRGIHRHYRRVDEALSREAETDHNARIDSHAVVLVSQVHRPALRALRYAQAIRAGRVTALSVDVDPDETRRLCADWAALDIDVPLVVLDSPYRYITQPVVDHVRQLVREHPGTLVNVFIPEYLVAHWWEHLLHNQTAFRLKISLLFVRGVAVTNVPWQLR